MKIINEIKDILQKAEHYEKVSSFNFINHNCSVKNEKIKIELKYSVSIQSHDKKDILGYCEHCKTVFYNEDFETKLF